VTPLPLPIPDPALILLIGPAGAGKSTFAAKHFRATEVVSSDRCRGLIADDESDQSVTRQAFSLLHHIVRERLRLQRLTVVDATNLHTTARGPLLRLARACGVPAIAIVFEVALATCLARNLSRPQRRVSPEAIAQHARELALARRRLAREGYQQIYVLREEELDEVIVRRVARNQAQPS
jgi:protein phosphatase